MSQLKWLPFPYPLLLRAWAVVEHLEGGAGQLATLHFFWQTQHPAAAPTGCGGALGGVRRPGGPAHSPPGHLHGHQLPAAASEGTEPPRSQQHGGMGSRRRRALGAGTWACYM